MSKQKPTENVDSTTQTQELKRRSIHSKKKTETEETERERKKTETEEGNENETISADDSEESCSSGLDKAKIEKRRNRKSKKKCNEEKQDTLSVGRLPDFKSYCNYLIASVVVVCVLYTIWITFDFGSLFKRKFEAKGSLSEVLKDMKNNFKPQSALTYRNLEVQLNKVFNVAHEPKAPAIITAIADRGAESTASDIGLYLGNTLAPERYILINDSTYWNDNPDDIKLRIDEEVTAKYQPKQLNVIIIDKLHKIPFEAAMIFHSYCDHDNSPFKRALFLFILPLNEIVSEATPQAIDSIAMHSLRKVWPDVVDDKVDSLVTRISGAVINIK